MSSDPSGLYARLGVDPMASAEAIAAAYRRKARVLHPDIPGTGDAAAFIRLKEAYDVLADAGRRAAYDRSARPTATGFRAAPVEVEPVWRGPRFSDLPVVLWVGLGGLFVLATGMAVRELSRLPSPPSPVAEDTRPVARSVLPRARPPALSAVQVPVGGAVTHYVLPGGGNAVVWRRDPARETFHPVGQIADFTPVRAVSLVPQHGLVAILLADGSVGFVDAARLAPGDRVVAERAYCAFNAGAPPRNGEVFARHGQGSQRLAIGNRGSEPVVVKLRDAAGRVAASVFLEPGGATEVAGLPDGVYRPEYAFGELWSRTCDSFTAGMRAQRFSDYASVAGLSPLVVPPNLSVAPAPVDIPDQAFEQD
jgi:hypothetical protein